MDQNTLRKVQSIEKEILVAVDKFCRDNNISYTLGYGTALGAVRHSGFIPWDDDIDICMPRQDYERFVDLWKKNGIKGFTLQDVSQFNKYSIINHTKIRCDNTIMASKAELKLPGHHGIWIDVFPMEKITKSKKQRAKLMRAARIRIVISRREIISNRGFAVKCVTTLVHFCPTRIRRAIWNYCNRMIVNTKTIMDDFEYANLSMSSLLDFFYPMDLFDKCEEIVFDGSIFKISKLKDEMLRITYGNYMELPPLEKRVCLHEPEVLEVQDYVRSYEY